MHVQDMLSVEPGPTARAQDKELRDRHRAWFHDDDASLLASLVRPINKIYSVDFAHCQTVRLVRKRSTGGYLAVGCGDDATRRSVSCGCPTVTPDTTVRQ